MSYRFDNKWFPHAPAVLDYAGLDAGSPLPAAALLEQIVMPEHDQEMQDVQPVKNTDGGWSLVVVDKPLFARVVDGYVTALHPYAAYDNVPVDRLTQEQMEEADLWHSVPVPLRRHIRLGWSMVDDSFEPPSTNNFRAQLIAGAVDTVTEARQGLSGAVDHTEVGGWMLNAMGLMFRAAGLPAPLYDQALQREAALTGESVTTLENTHRIKLEKFWGLFAETQGMRRAAQAAFASPAADFDMLLSIADNLRQQAAARIEAVKTGG